MFTRKFRLKSNFQNFTKGEIKVILNSHSQLKVAPINNFHSQLQVALYCRHELNIRSTTSLILAFASIHQPCRPFLFRYFSKAIVLPTDWTSVADLVQTFDSQLNAGSLPAILRKCKHKTRV